MSDKKFPNGFDSWSDTHFEIVQAIAIEINNEQPKGKTEEVHDEGGHGALYDLAKELTYKFEKKHCGRAWDGDFFDEIEVFIEAELY